MNDVEFSDAVETVLRDLRAQCAVQPDVRSDDTIGITLWAPDGSGQGLTPHPDGTAAELLVHLADQVQDWAVEALWSEGLSAVWPQCPTHPDTHPLTATVRTDAAVWVCPKRGTTVARIGELKTH
ncbi:hypothetical protein AVL59_01495 [Streptomyces griseochromogenes]|uniref:Uncharacterized protein n=1 Tax=Streptomyces griseochromogenes TaxID=68214 RepID=A0A1B1APD8_9ACTN|nr:hypothetical protein [Streptomyces griseochromogenes]ANP48421.1 hypothetical protein AVL59_01495 [Streptomyces griseochromogenes]